MDVNKNNFDNYFSLFEHARELEKSGHLEEALDIYLNILSEYSPEGSLYYERPAIILEKLKRYDESLKICDLAIKNQHDLNLHFSKEDFQYRKERLIKKIKKPALDKTKSKKPKLINDNLDIEVLNKPSISNEINYPDWYISISFGYSKSSNFPQALALAKTAPQFIENDVDGKKLYQSIYSHKPKEYLQFIKLYELINQWKSCFVIVNGQLMDRKIVGGLNYCYGDKCRSGNADFCYGASDMTKNPFGCHRLQISAYNSPWWSYGIFDTKGIFHVDKDSIRKRISEYSTPYIMCPCFSIDRINVALNNLPDIINPHTDSRWVKSFNGVSPSDYNCMSTIHLGSHISDDCLKENISTNENKNPSETHANINLNKSSLFSKIFSFFKK